MLNITNLKVDECAVIEKIDSNLKAKIRLLELGFVKGAFIKLLQISSLKKTYLVLIEGSVFALRESVAKGVFICKK